MKAWSVLNFALNFYEACVSSLHRFIPQRPYNIYGTLSIEKLFRITIKEITFLIEIEKYSNKSSIGVPRQRYQNIYLTYIRVPSHVLIRDQDKNLVLAWKGTVGTVGA
jgi:hypothetical protein